MTQRTLEKAVIRMEERIIALSDDLREFKEDQKEFNKLVKEEVKKNTSFRNRSYGAIAMISFIVGAIGGGIGWILSKIGGK